MPMDREDILLAFRALKGGFPAGDLRKAVRRQNALPVRSSLTEVLRSELKVPEAVLEPIRSSDARPDPRADRGMLDQISKMIVDEGAMTAAEFEKLAASVSAVMSSGVHPPIEVPPKLGEYEVRWEVRRDTHSGVFHGSHPNHGDVALKVFRKGSAPEGLKVRFTEPHPGLVRMIDVADAEGFRFAVSELVEGQPLNKLLRGKKLTAREALALAEKAGRTLGDLNARGFFHGSLRSSDIFVDRGKVKVKDFGGVEGSAGGDLRAFGEVLYEAAAGVPPFGPDDRRDVAPPRPVEVNKALDPEADRLIVAAMSGRYPSMQALVEDLGRWLRGEKPLAVAAPARGGRGVLVAGVLAVALIGAAAVWAFARSRRDPPPKETPSPVEPKPRIEPKKEELPKKAEDVPKKDETGDAPRDPEGPMTPSEEREIEEQCYRASRGDIEELGRLAERAVRRGPKGAWSEYYYARYLFEKGRYAEALVRSEEAARLKPEDVRAQELRFRTLLMCGEVARARDDLQKRMGRDFGRLNRQIRLATGQIAADPRDGTAYLERGAYWAHRPDWEQAERDFSAAAELGVRAALHFRAAARERLKRYREALEDVTRYLAEEPEAGGKAEAAALKAELEKRVKPE